MSRLRRWLSSTFIVIGAGLVSLNRRLVGRGVINAGWEISIGMMLLTGGLLARR